MLKPLGLPTGSVRALLLLALLARAILDLRAGAGIAPWLAVALMLGAAAYFSGRASAPRKRPGPGAETAPVRHPLGLPAGTVRTLVLLALAYGAWLWFRGHEPRPEDMPVAFVLGAFVLGVLVRWVLHRLAPPEDAGTTLFHHIQALVALLCAAGLVTLAATGRTAEVPDWVEPLLGSVTVYYFATR